MSVQPYISLKQLLNQIQNQIRVAFPATYWIKAEVAGIRKIGGHVYFDLMELYRGAKVAQIRACAFFGEGTNAIAGFEKVTGQKFTEGIKVGVRVAVNFHPVYGLSLVLYEIDSELTLGGIELQRKQTLEKLKADHPQIIQFGNGSYITPNKRLSLPKVIQRIALLTSTNSDAYNDFMHCLKNNEYGYKFYIDEYSVLVQGYGAQSSLYSALSKIRISGIKYDAVVLTRGGGAPADFLAFDDYHLALEVAQFPVPVITGIGHHANQGICDFFACVHTKTPSIAAQFILDHNYEFEKRLLEISSTIRHAGNQVLSRQSNLFLNLKHAVNGAIKDSVAVNSNRISIIQRAVFPKANQFLIHRTHHLMNKQLNLSSKAKSILYRFEKDLSEKSLSFTFTPKRVIWSEKQKGLALQAQVINRMPQVLGAERKGLDRFKENIQNLSPERILKRGFAIIKKDGQIVSNSSEIKTGDSIQIIHDQSLIDTIVKNKKDYDGRDINL